MERCESGRIGRFRKPLSRKAPGVRIPLSPIRRRGNIAAGDSKRGPADLREEKGTEGGPEGANPPLSDKKEREYSCGGFETRSRRPTGGERDRGRPRRGESPSLREEGEGTLYCFYFVSDLQKYRFGVVTERPKVAPC